MQTWMCSCFRLRRTSVGGGSRFVPGRPYMKLATLLYGTLAILSLSTAILLPGPPEVVKQGWIDSALETISLPFHQSHRWNYNMSAKVRLLLFWAGAEDVGGGYI